MQGPLKGLRVIDASTVLAGGFTSSMLGDFGADVIKLEQPKVGDSSRNLQPFKNGVSLPHKVTARNKKSITLNIGKPRGAELLKRMLPKTDILIENFRPGTMEKWGLGWKDLEPVNPKLVMLRISGYGQDGPHAKRSGFGTIAEAITGLPFRTGIPEGPPILSSIPLADEVTGLFGAFSVMFAIYNRDHGTGKGQVIDAALYETVYRMIEDQVIVWDQLGIKYGRIGNRMTMAAPRGAFQSRDGKWIAISAFTDVTAKRLLKTLAGDEVANDPRFRTGALRVQNIDALEAVIGGGIAQHDQAELLALFEREDVVASGVYDIEQVCADPQMKHREIIVKVNDPVLGEVKVPGVVPKFSHTPGAVEYLEVPLGHNNEEIFCGELGLSRAELEGLQREGIV